MLDAVLPLTLPDLERFQILARSIDAHFAELATCWVVVPDQQRAEIARAMPHSRFVVVPETQIVPEFQGRRVKGWYKQQLVKLAMADHVTTDNYLLFDSDVICARPIGRADLFGEGKALCHRYRNTSHARWYGWAERVLGVRRSGWVHGVTPTILNRQAVGELTAYLNARPAQPNSWWRRLIGPAKGNVDPSPHRWRTMLLDSLPWTEYSLYFTFLEATGRFEHYHAHAKQSLCGDCIWRRDRFESWVPTPPRSPRQPPFIVVQSIANIPPRLVLERIEPLLAASV